MANDYSAERQAPVVPPSGITLFFTGSYLVMKGKRHRKFGASSGSGKAQKDRIPPGKYWINPEEMWSDSPFKYTVKNVLGCLTGQPDLGDKHLASWGFHRITIHPYPGTDTQGRGGFFIHGGDYEGSLGCIDLTYEMEAFVKALDADLGDKRSCYLDLYVSYGK